MASKLAAGFIYCCGLQAAAVNVKKHSGVIQNYMQIAKAECNKRVCGDVRVLNTKMQNAVSTLRSTLGSCTTEHAANG